MNARMLVNDGYSVRRLTPRECERLMGWPDVEEICIIHVCNTKRSFDLASSRVRAASQSRSEPYAAGSAAGVKYLEPVWSAGPRSWPNNPLTGKPVALVADFDSEGKRIAITTPNGFTSLAVSAVATSPSVLHERPVSSVHLGVLISGVAAQTTRDGKAGSQPSSGRSMLLGRGSSYVVLSGQEIAERAKDAETCISLAFACLKSTTSQVGLNSRTSDSSLITLCCSVASAISGFIPEQTSAGDSFDLCVKWTTDWTRYAADGREIADGPRYRMCGNGVVASVSEWIARRVGQ